MQELPEDVAALESAFRAEDLKAARDIAHRISGVAALYRLPLLQDAVKSLQDSLNLGSPMTAELLAPVTNAVAEDLMEIQAAQVN